MEEKKCSKCGLVLAVDYFGKNQTWCKPCRNGYHYDYCKKNKEKIREYRKKYQAEKIAKDRIQTQIAVDNGLCGACRCEPLSTKRLCFGCAKKSREGTKRYRQTQVGALKEILKSAKSRARLKGIAYDLDYAWIDAQWERQNGCCALSGLPLSYGQDGQDIPGVMHPRAPSLDRKDSKLGYTKENTRLVCAQVNVALGQWGQISFLDMCEKVTQKNKSEDRNEGNNFH